MYTSNESYKQVEFDFLLENGGLITETDNQFQLSWIFVQISCWQVLNLKNHEELRRIPLPTKKWHKISRGVCWKAHTPGA